MTLDSKRQDIERGKIQDEICRLSLEHPNIIACLATGVGKTRALLKCISESTSSKKWLILVPEISLIENFKEDVRKHGYEYLFEDKIHDVLCYASLKNYRDTSYNLGLDECHHVSEIREDILQSIESDQRIGLSATLPYEVKERLSNLGDWHYHTVTTKEAVDLGILPQPKIYIKYISLDDKYKKYPYKIGKKTVKLTAEEYCKNLDKSVKYWMDRSEENEWAKRKMFSVSLQRKKFLSDQKTEAAKNLLKTIEDKRLITFCGSIEQARELGGKKSVHSKNSKNVNAELIDDFNKEVSSKLYACSMLKEGQNLFNIEAGLIVQLAGNDLQNVQAIGRLLRSSNPELYLIIVKNSRDDQYLKKVLEIIDGKEIVFL